MLELLAVIVAFLVALFLLYWFFPDQIVAMGRQWLRKRGKMVEKHITVDGRVWPYLEGGNPQGVPLVMVHGFAGDKDNWAMIAPYLTGDYRVIAPDLPGFGGNDRNPDLAWDIDSQAARLKDFMDAMGLQSPHLGGNSMGGWIALRYAIAYPDRLRSLTLLNNAGVNGAQESDLQKQAADEDYNPLILTDLDDADRLIAMVVHKPPYVPSRFKPALYSDTLRHRDLLDKIFWAIATEGRDAPLNDQLSAVKVPTLIIWGRHDRLIDVSCVAELKTGIANSEAHILEHVGHVPMIEDPKATAAIQRDFLARH
jgi:abhydrolase domain-containing protein 6